MGSYKYDRKRLQQERVDIRNDRGMLTLIMIRGNIQLLAQTRHIRTTMLTNTLKWKPDVETMEIAVNFGQLRTPGDNDNDNDNVNVNVKPTESYDYIRS